MLSLFPYILIRNAMEDKKNILSAEELEQVSGGVVLNPNKGIKVNESYACPYCKTAFPHKETLENHMKVCSKNPANDKIRSL